MAITNYGELKSAVADWGNRADLTTRIEDFCRYAHDEIVRELVIGADLDLDDDAVSLPSDFGAVVALYAAGTELIPTTADQMTASYTGLPLRYRIDTGEAILQPTPDTLYPGKLLYRLAKPFFTSDTSTNTALDRYPHMYLHGAMAELKRYLEDDNGADRYETRFRAQMVDAIRAESAQTTSGAQLQMRPSGVTV